MTTSYRYVLRFRTDSGSVMSVRINNATNTNVKNDVVNAMDRIIAGNAFLKDKGNLVSKDSADYYVVETRPVVLD